MKQTKRKPQETLDFKLTKSRRFFSVKHTFNLGLDFNWVIGLTSLEIYNAIFNLTEENNKFEFYSDSCDEFSFVEIKVELEETLCISDITPTQVQHEKLGPRIVQAYNKLGSEKSRSDSFLILLRDMLDLHSEILKTIFQL